MREIKFRAWDLDNLGMWYSDRECDDGEWGKVWHIDNKGIHFEEYRLRYVMENDVAVDREEWHTPNQVIMQYTGLKDKNLKDIYISDILHLKEKGYFNQNNLKEFKKVVKYNDYGCNIYGDYGYEGEAIDEIYEMEVIGNIYENPELIKEIPE